MLILKSCKSWFRQLSKEEEGGRRKEEEGWSGAGWRRWGEEGIEHSRLIGAFGDQQRGLQRP